jgi:hypothetical protein
VNRQQSIYVCRALILTKLILYVLLEYHNKMWKRDISVLFLLIISAIKLWTVQWLRTILSIQISMSMILLSPAHGHPKMVSFTPFKIIVYSGMLCRYSMSAPSFTFKNLFRVLYTVCTELQSFLWSTKYNTKYNQYSILLTIRTLGTHYHRYQYPHNPWLWVFYSSIIKKLTTTFFPFCYELTI